MSDTSIFLVESVVFDAVTLSNAVAETSNLANIPVSAICWYPNANVAYDSNNNSGKVYIKNNDFSFTIKYPNSFYSQLGNKYIEPHVIIQITDSSGYKYDPVFVKLDDGIPYRSLSHHPPVINWKRQNAFFLTYSLQGIIQSLV